jgi:hypothetical protein
MRHCNFIKISLIYHISLNEVAAQSRQHLSPQEEEEEEEVLVKWVLQYYFWGLPLRIYHLKQFAFEIMLQYSVKPL